jgi:xanthine dehydrogenase YagS FAD-binding subunit
VAKPWRAHEAEQVLTGRVLDESAAEQAAQAAFAPAVVHSETGFKPELGRRTLVRALLEVADMRI